MPELLTRLRFRRGVGSALLVCLLLMGAATSTLLTQVVSNCTSFNFNPTTASFTASGGTGSVACDKGPVTNGVYTGCSWVATSNDSWITITSGAASAANGVGRVNYTVAPNTSSSSRTGSITFSSGNYGSAVYTITQSGTPVTVSPQSLNFSYTRGGTLPSAQTVTITSSAYSASFTASATVLQGSGWLTVSPASGSLVMYSATLTIGVNPSALSPGSYTGTISINVSGAGLTVPVSLNVTSTPATQPLITPKILSARFNPDQPSVVPPPVLVSVTSPNGARTPFSITPQIITPSPGPQWIPLDTIVGVTPLAVSIPLSPQGLHPGRYLAVLRYTTAPSNGIPAQKVSTRQAGEADQQNTAIIVTVGPAAQIFGDPDSFSLDDLSLPQQSLFVKSLGADVSVSPTAVVLNGPDTWLTIPNAYANRTPATYDFQVSRTGLTPNRFQGVIAVAEVGGATGTVVPVQLQVGSGSGALVADRDSLTFAAESGGPPPASQSVSLSTNAAATASVKVNNDAPWLVVPATVQVPGVLTVSVRADQVAVGPHADSITISLPGSNLPPVSLAVGLSVDAPPAAGPARQIMSQIADGDGWTTTITLVNNDTVRADFTLNLWDNSGNPLVLPFESLGSRSSYSGAIRAGGAITITTGNGPALVAGWAELISSQQIGGLATFSQRVGGGRVLEAASPLELNAINRFLMPYDNTQGSVSAVALVNPTTQTSSITANLRKPDGSMLASQTVALAGRGHAALPLTDLFSQAANGQGVAEFVSAGGGIAGLGLRFNSTGVFTSLPVITDRSLTIQPGRRVIAQIADGDTWKTTVILLNGDVLPAFSSLGFTKGDGNPLQLSFEGLSSGSTLQQFITGNGSTFLSSTGTASTLSQGWAGLSGSSGVRGLAIFRHRVPGNPDFEAASPLGLNAGNSFLLPFDNTNGLLSAVALVNPSDLQVTVQASARNEDGSSLASTNISLPPRGQRALALTDLFSGVGGRRGVAEFLCPTGITGLGLRFNSTGAFTSLPVITR